MSYLEYKGLEKAPFGYWDNIENVKEFMRYVSWKEGYKEIEDWYKCSRNILNKYKCGELFNKRGNIVDILNLIYDYQYHFLPWKFKQVYNKFWNSKENQKQYMYWLFKELKFTTMEDWYQINWKIFCNNYGGGLIDKYNNSPQIVLKNTYPEYEWVPWKFKQVSQGFWNSKENQKWYMDWLFKELKYETMEDWYQINWKIFCNNYGGGLLDKYDNSYQFIFKNTYPEYEWIPWKFQMISLKFWDSIENQKWYMDWLFKELKYETIEDWYQISQKIIGDNYGWGLLDKYNSYKLLLSTLYPEYPWDLSKFSNLKGEGILNDFLTQNYKEIEQQYRIDWCKNPETNRHLPFDFCIPEYKIIIELDGGQHFEQVQDWGDPEETRKRDEYKMKMANENGYTVIRLLWEDVYNDKNNWKEKLQESIKLYETPQRIYLSDIYEKYYEI